MVSMVARKLLLTTPWRESEAPFERPNSYSHQQIHSISRIEFLRYDLPSIQNSNPILIPKLFLNTNNNHLLPRLPHNFRLSTQHPRRLCDFLSHP